MAYLRPWRERKRRDETLSHALGPLLLRKKQHILSTLAANNSRRGHGTVEVDSVNGFPHAWQLDSSPKMMPPELFLAHTGPDGLPRFTTLPIGKTFFPCNLQSINQSTSNNRELLHIAQRPTEKVNEYYHRVSSLWQKTNTPEEGRADHFLWTILPGALRPTTGPHVSSSSSSSPM
jgi:hypothetical protein